MARQEINIGTAPTGAGGDTTRSGAVKINAMTQELYLRTDGLGTAAKANIGTSPGNAMPVGAFGLGANVAPLSNFTSNIGFTTHGVDGNQSPAPGNGGVRITQNLGGNYYSEIVLTANSIDAPTFAFRQFGSTGSPGAWNIVYTNKNTTRAQDGTLKAI